MGLAERRAALEFETNVLPGLKAQINEAAGFELPLEVHWESLTVAGESRLYNECWTPIYFEPLIAALKSVGRDKLGKDALHAGLKKAVIQNTKSNCYGEGFASFEGGTLTLDHDPLANAGDVTSRTEGAVKALEDGL